MKINVLLFVVLAICLTACGYTVKPGLYEQIKGRWQAQRTHSVETDSVGKVLFERTDSTDFGIEFTATHIRYYYTYDKTKISKEEPYTLRGKAVVSAVPNSPYKLSVVEVSPVQLVMQQVTLGLANTKVTSTIKFARMR